FCCIQGARSEHNGLCDRRATKKTAKKTLICSSYLLYVPYLGFFEFVHNAKKRGKRLLESLLRLFLTDQSGIH
ncbi:MAG TPA: hypothetical protein ENF70_04790, partial [Deltaproteobacteria bacterium]|nr:hypothetical protein [Deltaproteobacteria bacterium]